MKARMDEPTLSRRERQVMDALFRLGSGSARDVLDAIDDPPSYSAVRTFLRLLEEKGHVTHVEENGRYVYRPKASRSTASKRALGRVVETFFGGSVGDTIAALVDTGRGKLSGAELDRLEALIDRARKEGR
jgi:BlaI family transcriptional regulator, penicillinase repressor